MMGEHAYGVTASTREAGLDGHLENYTRIILKYRDLLNVFTCIITFFFQILSLPFIIIINSHRCMSVVFTFQPDAHVHTCIISHVAQMQDDSTRMINTPLAIFPSYS